MSRPSIENRSRPIKSAKQKKKFFGIGIIVFVMILSLSYQALAVEWFSDNSELKVWVFDVGQADAIFIETPNGEQILVDAGADGTILTKLGEVMLPWDRTIDAVIITHPHADHEGGLPEVLRRYNIETIYETGVSGYNDLQDTVRQLADEQGSEMILVTDSNPPLLSGEGWLASPKPSEGGGEGLEVKILAPAVNLQNKKIDNLNASSIVLLITYGETSILLTGDAPIDEENDILTDLEQSVDVLKVAHHGSVTSTSGNFLETVLPRFAIISVGTDNDYGHPNPATLERLNSRDIKTFRTDFDGDVLITSNGREPVVVSRLLPF